MIPYTHFLAALKDCGVDTILSLPCSSFSGVLMAVENDASLDHIAVTSEAEAVGIAAGVWLAGRSPAILIQNSGFCDAINPICSLLYTFGIPIPFVVSVRGWGDIKDEPQHDLIGRRFLNVLKSLELNFTVLDKDCDSVKEQFNTFFQDVIFRGETGIIAVPPGVIETSREPCRAVAAKRSEEEAALAPCATRPNFDFPDGSMQCGYRSEVLAAICESAPADTIFVCSTGYIGRDLYTLGDSPNRLYVAGSMGCASAIAFGISRYTNRTVVVLDGDGAALMRMGNFATIANAKPGRLIHIILNNGVYESTGGQFNYGRRVDFSLAARACGYSPVSVRVDSLDVLRQMVDVHSKSERPTRPILIDALIATHSPVPVLRPKVLPPEQARRLKRMLQTRQGAALQRIAG
jgi:phosphonopyruvate decarboxylase